MSLSVFKWVFLFPSESRSEVASLQVNFYFKVLWRSKDGFFIVAAPVDMTTNSSLSLFQWVLNLDIWLLSELNEWVLVLAAHNAAEGPMESSCLGAVSLWCIREASLGRRHKIEGERKERAKGRTEACCLIQSVLGRETWLGSWLPWGDSPGNQPSSD